MKKIIFLIMMLLSFSARAEEDYSQYYFYGKFNTKKIDSVVITSYFNIHDGRAYLSDDSSESGGSTILSIPDGHYKLQTQALTTISFSVKSNKILKLEVISNSKSLQDPISTKCQEALFLYDFLSITEDYKNNKGAYFRKYELSNYPKGGDYIFILKNDITNQLFAVVGYVNGMTAKIDEPAVFSKDPNNQTLSVSNGNKINKHIEINSCSVTYYKDSL